MITLFISAFVTFFLVIDPLGCAPIYAGLSRGAGPRQRRAMAIRATLIASAILMVFAIVGEPLLRALGISLEAFRVAGGIMLFLIALEMVFEKRTERREGRAEEIAKRAEAEHREIEDISVFPMAIPMIAGPGSIATVMLFASHNHGLALVTVLAALVTVMGLMALALLAAGPIMRVLGARIEAVITRMLGVILAALATQFVVDGLKASFG
ncbi:MarC family protein [Sphingomonas sp.]|uniref:MarC family protein n=1 Tax=Sphingomonas sp. TaxID=28214 RepID=UPI000DB4AD1A|nr:MarC family protein [Sphingomonas sp.]PZU11582.1 MAG: MarC family transcriptional regulator [Sphingomonas sp.]